MRASSHRLKSSDATFPPDRNYMRLTLRDLLEARHHYHVHLAHLPNVVGTAVGRYLIHERDWSAKHRPDAQHKRPKTPGRRTLFNSVVKPWSWPSVIVFVKHWEPRTAFAKGPDQMVPRVLYLPDGRVVPTCTVYVEEEQYPAMPDYQLSFANSFLGGGYLTFAEVQGQEHLGSIACLVTDGDQTYALTNRHVSGAPGREMFTRLSGKIRRIGVSDRNQVGLKRFTETYAGWPGENVQLHLDAGLIRIDDVRDWTTQVAGMGPLDEWLDLTTDTLTLDLIDQPVRAFGAASGELRGRIAALFYRYSSAAGTDYVTEFLIRPESADGHGTLHGDSGTLWFWEQWKDREETNRQLIALRPFAMQWGGDTWVADGESRRVGRFALAASLSVVCRELNVTLVRDWNTGLPEYWGPVGHYTIGYFACDRGLGRKLGRLMKANQQVVSYPLASISSRTKIGKKAAGGLVPLADVPDRLWAHGKMLRGAADRPNHFADMDRKDPKHGNKTLLQLCHEDYSRVNPDFWLEYYADVGDTGRGCLPFRVWQFFDEMKDAVHKKDVDRYVCAAGVLAHYVGDACQPLHLSYLHDGEPQPDGKVRGQGVHSVYEEKMLRQNTTALLPALENELKKRGARIKIPKSGQEAAIEVVKLMQRTSNKIKPIKIVDAYDAGDDLWDRFGALTVTVMADGVRTLRAVWKGAWRAQNGEKRIANSHLGEADHKKLIALYMRKTWAPSKTLRTIGSILK